MTPDAPDLPPARSFDTLAERVANFTWRPGIELTELPSPSRLAPHALAVAADLVVDDVELAHGRLVLLHDPSGRTEWQGTHRLVTLTSANVDAEMAADPLVAEVAWGWLIEALGTRTAAYAAVAGTVTTTSSRGFGGRSQELDAAGIEIRASWTPLLGSSDDLEPHLQSWQDLLHTAAGLPNLPEGIASLQARHQRTTTE